MAGPLEQVARMRFAELEDVALAIAAEFTAVDAAVVHAHLDRLAVGLDGIAELDAGERAEGLLEELAGRQRFEADWLAGPDSLLLDRVVERRRGHPLALVIVYAAVARRAGVTLYPVGNERFVILADGSSSPTIAIDPTAGGRRPPAAVAWLCPHVVGVMVLQALSVRFLERGELEASIRAARLGLVLPLSRPMRARVRARVIALHARLN